MLNMIRADFYRLRHSKGFWITLGVTMVLCAYLVYMGSGGPLIGGGEDPDPAKFFRPDAVSGFTALTNSSAFLVILPFLVIVLGSEYSKGTLKNIITTGMSRRTFFFAKFVSFTCIVMGDLLCLFLTSSLTGFLIGGFGTIKSDTLINYAYYFFGLILFVITLSAIVNLVMFWRRNAVVGIVAAVIGPSVLMTAESFMPDGNFLEYFDYFTMMDKISSTTFANMGGFMQQSIVASAVVLVGFLLLTNYFFGRQDW